jgi:hypothetical protein
MYALTNTVLGAIAWSPEIRNILGVLVGIVVLCGSVYLLLATNTGPRTGMLLALAGLLGWMTTMGLIWWLYGIGLKGSPTHWEVKEVVNGNQPDQLAVAEATTDAVTRLPDLDDQALVTQILEKYPELEKKVNTTGDPAKQFAVSELIEAQPSLLEEFELTADDLGGWNILEPSDKQRGDATAVADAALVAEKAFGGDTTSAKYRVVDVYDQGGKGNEYPRSSNGMWDRVTNKVSSIVHWQHPTHYAVVVVQAVVPQETRPGTAPPTPLIDTRQPQVAVVMVRNLGDLRFPAAMTTIVCGVLFGLTCNTLHRRDKLIARNRAAALAA